ncbi:MAG: taurine transporter subunit, partial [Yersinia sp. (in: enterobacteria)]
MSLHSTLRNQAITLPVHRVPANDEPPRVASKAVRRLSVGNGLWLSITTLIVVVALWWAVTALQLISPLFLPAPQQVLHQLLVIASPQGFMDATLWQHLAASLGRILIALLAAVALGVPTGIAMGLSSTVRGVLDP